MKDKIVIRVFILIISLVSCQSDNDREILLFTVEPLSYKKSIKNGFERVPEEPQMLEKQDGIVVIGLHYTNDLKTLLAKTWKFEMKSEDLDIKFLDSIVYNNNMFYVMLPYAVNTVGWNFCVEDAYNRIYIGYRVILKEVENYVLFKYNYPLQTPLR